MKWKFLRLSVLFSFSLVYGVAHAQVDPSNSLLLKSNSSDSAGASANDRSDGDDLDNGRYVIKANPGRASAPTPSNTPKPAVAPKPISKTVVPTPAPTPAKPESAAIVPAAPAAAAPMPPDKSLTRSMKDAVLGSNEDIDSYKEKLQPDDSRRNIMAVSFAPGYFYTNSSSNYWYRRYFSGGPGVDASVSVWLTPFIGLNVSYFTTVGADMNADPNTPRTIAVDHRNTDFALQFRKYFSYSKKSPSLTFSVGYDDYQMIVPSTEANRIGLQEYGLDLGLHLKMPTSNYTAWTMGADVLPFLKVNEQSTGIAAQSGSDPSSFALKFSIGQDFTLDRNNKVFWRATERVQKSEYSGVASQPDPITGTAPNGVSVTETATLFEFGYSWGD